MPKNPKSTIHALAAMTDFSSVLSVALSEEVNRTHHEGDLSLHLHLMPRFRISELLSLPTVNDFMLCTVELLPLQYLQNEINACIYSSNKLGLISSVRKS